MFDTAIHTGHTLSFLQINSYLTFFFWSHQHESCQAAITFTPKKTE